MRQQLARTRNNKARERDDISPRTLKVCAAQLAGVFLHSFGLSLRLKKVPSLLHSPGPEEGMPQCSE